MTGPLHDVRVVVLAGMGPVPFTSMVLADLGADVVRVTRPPDRQARRLAQAEALAPKHDLVNRGVRSVQVDLKSPSGVECVLSLCSAADVMLEGFRPGVAARLGLDDEVMRERNAALVIAHLTGYGQSGPLADTAGHDINYVAQSGALHAFGSPDAAPRPPVNILGDYAGGGLVAALGVVAAVLEARSSGRGQSIDAAMVDGVALLTAKLQGLRAAGLLGDEPGTSYLDGASPSYTTYRCADGRYVAVGALEADFYQEFIARLGVDTTDWPAQNDQTQWPRLRELIAAAIAQRPMTEWAAIYDGTDACVTPVLTFDEAAAHPHNAQRGLYERVGDAVHPAPAPRFTRTGSRRPSTPESSDDLAAQDVLKEWSGPRPR